MAPINESATYCAPLRPSLNPRRSASRTLRSVHGFSKGIFPVSSILTSVVRERPSIPPACWVVNAIEPGAMVTARPLRMASTTLARTA